MALPPGFELETAVPAGPKLPPGFQLETAPAPMPETGIPGPRRGGFLTGVGRGLASLADVTVGGVIPAAIQQVGYPIARLGRSPEEATAITQQAVSATQQPFGKLFGVTNTPEYQQEAGRQLMDFIGQNFQKGADWISRQTGVPAADVENMLGSMTIAAPAIAKPVGRAVRETAAPVVEQVVAGAKAPFEKQIQARRERLSLEDYARGPQIDAAKEAQRLGLAVPPENLQSSVGPRALTMVAGEKGQLAAIKSNIDQVRKVALNELDLPPTTQLNKPETFKQARAKLAAPYDEISQLPTMRADEAVVGQLNDLRPAKSLIGKEESAATVNRLVDEAIEKTSAGLTGAELLDNVRSLRADAQKVYRNKNATPAQVDMADSQLAIANTLEQMIESNVFNPKLLDRFRDARQKMARTYAYEGATDLNTGIVDVKKLARITAKDKTLTGDIASLGQVAGNSPDAFTSKPLSGWGKAARLGRTGVAGTLGGVSGYLLGQDYMSAALGSVLGAAGGEAGQFFAARRLASPEYQRSLNVRDMRIPVNQLAAAQINYGPNQMVPYQAPVEVLMPDQGPYQPNFTMQPNQYGPQVTPVMPEGNRLLGASSPEGTINALRAEDARRAGVSRALGQQAEAQQAAAEAAARRPTSREIMLEIDPVTGQLREASQGIKGATPETFSNFGAALQTAADKVTSGKRFDLTAAEKVAWDKTRVDLSEVAPGFKTLTDKAIAEKMLDRAWVEQTAAKAREKAAAFEQLAARAKSERDRQSAIANRERMMDLAEQMEGTLGRARPDVSGKQQGPKTREFQRNRLRGDSDQDVLNKLLGQ